MYIVKNPQLLDLAKFQRIGVFRPASAFSQNVFDKIVRDQGRGVQLIVRTTGPVRYDQVAIIKGG